MAKEQSNLQGEILAEDKKQLQEPPLFKVLLHNDDYTTMDFVVMILETIFNKDSTEATKIMLDVHHQGMGIAGIYTREIGETKISQVHHLAQKKSIPIEMFSWKRLLTPPEDTGPFLGKRMYVQSLYKDQYYAE